MNAKSCVNNIITLVQPIVKENPERLLSAAYLALDKFSENLLLHAMQKMGIFTTSEESYSYETLKNIIKFTPKYEKLWQVLLNMLVEANLLIKNHDVYSSTLLIDEHKITPQTLEEMYKNFCVAYPEMQDFIKLLYPCGINLPEILRGDISPLTILFPNYSLSLLDKFYKNNPSMNFISQLAANCVRNFIITKLPHLLSDKKIRILEVGAGTGSTSEFIFSAIDEFSERIEYVYTDMAQIFLQHAEENYISQRPYITSHLLDIEKPLAEQGFNFYDFDIVIAANVLHATKYINHSSQQIHHLLNSHGCLVLCELTSVEKAITLIFGLLDGWWLFDDAEARIPGSPLLSIDRWQKQLLMTGFQEVATLLDNSKKAPGYLAQNVIIAQK